MKLMFLLFRHKVVQLSLQKLERRDEEIKELFSSLQSQAPYWLAELMRRKTQWEVYRHNRKYFSSTKQHVFLLLLSVLKEMMATVNGQLWLGCLCWCWNMDFSGCLWTPGLRIWPSFANRLKHVLCALSPLQYFIVKRWFSVRKTIILKNFLFFPQ